ncbi:MAG: CNNM domain-containing protein [Nitrospinota bacterium]
MTLVIYLLIALVFSFLCSIAEAVILSVTTPYITLMEQNRKASATTLKQLKEDINTPLAAILTLNTIAHTIGAAGVGAEATMLFGSQYIGIISAILTILILIFSEIIPKTLGTLYWRSLAPVTAYLLKGLVRLLYPFVRLSGLITNILTRKKTLKGLNREEFLAMAKLGEREDQLGKREIEIVTNLLQLRDVLTKDAMTPRTVVFSLHDKLTVEECFKSLKNQTFSRIPLYKTSRDEICEFVLRSDILMAQAKGEKDRPVSDFSRELPALPESISLSRALERFMSTHIHIHLIVDEYGMVKGILTLEDIIETILGLEIVDEGDKTEDMQKLARRLWKHRAREMGLNIDDL